MDEPISQWIEELKAGDEDAARQLWRQFFQRLIGLVRHKLGAMPRRSVDEEDVVVSAFETFFRRAGEGQFPALHDRNDLWALLVKIAERKAANVVRAHHRLKRGGGAVRGESAFLGADGTEGPGMGQAPGREPTPELAAILAEDFQRLLRCLADDELRRIALLKLEGHSNEEIAAQTDRSLPTIERRLRLIRARWEEAGEGEARAE